MSLHDSFLKLKFDKRMKAWNLNQKSVTEKEMKENIENLQDDSENAEPMVLFPNPSETTHTDEQHSQVIQVRQEGPLNDKNDTADNTQPPATDQENLQKAQGVATESSSTDKEENRVQKPDEDSSNPWW